jgi:uncharacterized coiled-coil protein SlyX
MNNNNCLCDQQIINRVNLLKDIVNNDSVKLDAKIYSLESIIATQSRKIDSLQSIISIQSSKIDNLKSEQFNQSILINSMDSNIDKIKNKVIYNGIYNSSGLEICATALLTTSIIFLILTIFKLVLR